MDTLASLMEVKLDIREKRTEIPMRVRNSFTICDFKCKLNFINRHGRDVTLKLRQLKVFLAILKSHFIKIYSKMSQDLC